MHLENIGVQPVKSPQTKRRPGTRGSSGHQKNARSKETWKEDHIVRAACVYANVELHSKSPIGREDIGRVIVKAKETYAHGYNSRAKGKRTPNAKERTKLPSSQARQRNHKDELNSRGSRRHTHDHRRTYYEQFNSK